MVLEALEVGVLVCVGGGLLTLKGFLLLLHSALSLAFVASGYLK